jgi:two-component system NtrC family response regulator
MKRATIMADTDRIGCDDLGLPRPPVEDGAAPGSDLDLRLVRDEADRGAITTAIARTNGNIVKAAELLNVSRPTLYDMMKRLAIK